MYDEFYIVQEVICNKQKIVLCSTRANMKCYIERCNKSIYTFDHYTLYNDLSKIKFLLNFCAITLMPVNCLFLYIQSSPMILIVY